MEIERKFRIRRLPESLEQYPYLQIEQGYLCTKPVVRIRKSNEDYILTYKSKDINAKNSTAIQNKEIELPLQKESYEHLKEKIDHRLIIKTRYLIPLPLERTAELDVFSGHLKGLIFVEVEFPSVESADTFEPPDWFGEDVSMDKRYHNTYLSQIDSAQELLEKR